MADLNVKVYDEIKGQDVFGNQGKRQFSDLPRHERRRIVAAYRKRGRILNLQTGKFEGSTTPSPTSN